MIERWVEVLHDELSLTSEEIADISWLATIRYQAARQNQADSPVLEPVPEPASERTQPARQPEISKTAPPAVSPPEPTAPTVIPPEQKLGIVPKSQSVSNDATAPKQSPRQPIKVVSAPALREPLTLIKALRPLMEKVPTRRIAGLDERATAQKIADERVWTPITQPAIEPQFELALVVDESASMLIWRRTVLELQRIFQHYGAFRDVRVWGLVMTETDEIDASSAAKAKVYIRSGFGMPTSQQNLYKAERLIDPNGRRLVLVVTDCISAMWRQDLVLPLLKVWADNGPMAIVQMLPSWMWVRTVLRQATDIQLWGTAPGMSNHRLSVSRLPALDDAEEDAKSSAQNFEVRMPVITLEPSRIAIWGQMVAAKGGIRAPGVAMLTRVGAGGEQPSSSAKTLPALTAEQRVQKFRSASTPMARQLAGLVSAAPVIYLPVIRLIQETLLPDSRQVHIAEVLFGGLLTPKTPPSVHTHPDDVIYRFWEPDVRSLLLQDAPVPDTIQVLSEYVIRYLGKANLDNFINELIIKMEADDLAIEGEDLQSFVEVTAEVLQRKGKQYDYFVDKVEQKFYPPKVPAAPVHFPPLQPFDFETAQLVDSYFPPLQTEAFTVITFENADGLERFDFTAVTLQRRSRLLRRDKWEIQRQPQSAYRLVEKLPNDGLLEMVNIPAGTFVMGSPQSEIERNDSESPQHEVTIEPFFMGRYPVTQAQWRAVAGLPQVDRALEADPSSFKGGSRPVESVSWDDAVEFCARLSVHTGRDYRLPTEAEWEYACRAGTTTPFHFGETISTEVANYNGNAYAEGPKGKRRGETTPVDYFKAANTFGLSDMHGNVWEWCQDHWHNGYEGAPTNGSAWLTDDDEAYRVLRGGAWNNDPWFCRSAFRLDSTRENHGCHTGFRVSCSSPRT